MIYQTRPSITEKIQDMSDSSKGEEEEEEAKKMRKKKHDKDL